MDTNVIILLNLPSHLDSNQWNSQCEFIMHFCFFRPQSFDSFAVHFVVDSYVVVPCYQNHPDHTVTVLYISLCAASHYQYKRKNWESKMIKNMLTRMEESDTYLGTVSRHRWNRQITMKVDGLGAFSQHCGFHQLMKATVLAESYILSIFILICLLQRCLLTVAR